MNARTVPGNRVSSRTNAARRKSLEAFADFRDWRNQFAEGQSQNAKGLFSVPRPCLAKHFQSNIFQFRAGREGDLVRAIHVHRALNNPGLIPDLK